MTVKNNEEDVVYKREFTPEEIAKLVSLGATPDIIEELAFMGGVGDENY